MKKIPPYVVNQIQIDILSILSLTLSIFASNLESIFFEIDFIALTPLQLGNILDNENIFLLSLVVLKQQIQVLINLELHF